MHLECCRGLDDLVRQSDPRHNGKRSGSASAFPGIECEEVLECLGRSPNRAADSISCDGEENHLWTLSKFLLADPPDEHTVGGWHLSSPATRRNHDLFHERRCNYAIFYRYLADWMPIAPGTPGYAPMGVPLLFDTDEQRNRVRDKLRASDVECRPIVAGNLARHPAARKHTMSQAGPLPGADCVNDCGLYLGLHAEPEKELIEEVCQVVVDAL